MVIRKAQISDAEAFWQMQYELDKETKFMMYEPGERIKDMDRIENLISQSVSGPNLLLLTEDNGKIAGYISAQRGTFHRTRHSAYIVTGIREAYQHRGIGTGFFTELMDWALKAKLKRLELTVMCPNIHAGKLYERFGFEVEGIKKYSMLVDGEYVDEYYMAKIL